MTPALADFGVRPIGSHDVDDGVLLTIRKWANTYLHQTETERSITGPNTLGRPKDSGYMSALSDVDMEWEDRRLPAVIVTTAPTEGNPHRARGGLWYADYRVVVSCVVRGPNATQTRTNASLTELSIRRLLLQMVTKEVAFISQVWWKGSGVAPVPDNTRNTRYLAAGTIQTTMTVANAVQERSGPNLPDSAPYGPPAVITEIDINVDGSTIVADSDD